MALIDHRILIPASPEHVWRFVGDLRRNAEWHVNVKALSLLTSSPKISAGTRFRVTQQRGRDQVWEVTAWYDRFGYEYHVVEGSPFRQNKGLLRLQETPEGTVVQWTMDYTGGGLFGGAGKAQEQIIIESLQKLYKLITRSKEVDTFQAKSLMRDDPGVEARANYRPRHPTSIPTESGESVRVPKSPYASPTPNKPMPAVPMDNPFAPPAALPSSQKLDDTRPRPAVLEPLLSAAASLEPDFLVDEPTTPFTDIPSEALRVPPPPVKPFEPPMPVIPPLAPPPVIPPAPLDPLPTLKPDFVEDNTTAPLVTPPAPVMPPAPVSSPPPVMETPVSAATVAQPEAQVKSEATPSVPEQLKTPEPVKPATITSRDKLSDTSKLSVFEIFGLPKPSQTQPMQPLNMDSLSATGRITALIEEAVPVETPVSPVDVAVEIPVIAVAEAAPKRFSVARQFGKRALYRRNSRKVRGRFNDE